jgi:hypothetical protein
MLEIFSKRPMIVLLSVLWGLGLATLFASVANSRNCIIVRGELPEEIEKKVFQYPDLQDKCYTYKSYITPCENEIYTKVPIVNKTMKQ